MNSNDLIGLIPCAGKGTRLGALSFSKELYPISTGNDKKAPKDRAVSCFLIDHMKDAGVTNFHLVIREGKWDIPKYFNDHKQPGIDLCYHVTNVDYGVPFSLNTAYPFIHNKIVCLGFPDILFKPKNVYHHLLNKLESHADTSIVLGVMPINRPQKWDMITYDKENKVEEIIIKPKDASGLKYGWFCAVWNSAFSDYLNSFIAQLYIEKSHEELRTCEVYIGDVIRAAIADGLEVESVIFEEGKCLDIGTPEDLRLANSFF